MLPIIAFGGGSFSRSSDIGFALFAIGEDAMIEGGWLTGGLTIFLRFMVLLIGIKGIVGTLSSFMKNL